MKKVLKFALLILVGALVIWTFWFLWQKSRPKVKKYEIEVVKTGSIEKHTVATGKVDPRNEILIKPQMSGIIAAVYKEAGDQVKAGDVIAKIKVIPDMVRLLNTDDMLFSKHGNVGNRTLNILPIELLVDMNHCQKLDCMYSRKIEWSRNLQLF